MIRSAGRRILLADDDGFSRRLYAKYLEEEFDKSVDVAVDGMQLLDKAKHTLYRLIVTDYRMPHYSGLEAVDVIRKYGLNKDTPIIVASADDVCKEAFAAGADRFFRKPVVIDELLADCRLLYDSGRGSHKYA